MYTIRQNRMDMRGSRKGGGRSRPPPEKSQNIGFLSNTGPDPLKNHKTTKPDLMLGHHQPALAGRCWLIYSGFWILYSIIN